MASATPAIEVSELEKRYGDVHAVAGLHLTVETGEVFGLLGPNGAGKTTTVEILEGYRRPDRGPGPRPRPGPHPRRPPPATPDRGHAPRRRPLPRGATPRGPQPLRRVL